MAHTLKLLAEKYSQVTENLNGPSENISYVVNVDNTVCPMDGNEISQIVDKHGVKMEWLGAAKGGNVWEDERTAHYKFKVTGPTGSIDSLVSELSEVDGIEFTDSSSSHSMEENHDETDMSNPEERTEVHIAKEILSATDMEKVKSLAQELLKMHGQE